MTLDDQTVPSVRMSGVVKRYGPLEVLQGLDLEVIRGQKVALIGRSGSGKSTILRILMALEGIDEGRVELDGTVLWSQDSPARSGRAERLRLRAHRSKVGMVFQHFNLFPHLTVLGNVTLGPRRVRGVDRDEAEAAALTLLERVGLRDKAHAHPAQLSGGQQQRVAIARALAMQPRLMLFDEVTSALDPELVGEVLGVLRDLAFDADMTMMLVTHQMHFAKEIADRVVFIDQGQVVEQGPPEQLLEDPCEERTRTFLRAVLEV